MISSAQGLSRLRPARQCRGPRRGGRPGRGVRRGRHVGKPDFSDLAFTVNDSRFRYGAFLNALIAFLSIAAVVYVFVVQPMNVLMERLRPKPAAGKPVRPCPECESDIPATARRCAFCTAEVRPAVAPG
jgi:large conductance mechanosensitive channel